MRLDSGMVRIGSSAALDVSTDHVLHLVAMNRYFVAVPEKFSRPQGAPNPDPRLPCVL